MSLDRNTIKVSAFAIILAFLLAVVRLWQLQIIQGSDMRKASEGNRFRAINLYAPRGIIYDRNGIPLVKNAPSYSVSVTPGMMKQGDLEKIADLLSVDPSDLQKKIQTAKGSLEPVTLKGSLDFDELAKVESRLCDFPALQVNVDITRDYIYKDVASHLIGYIGKITAQEEDDPNYSDVPNGGAVGQWGIERLYDKQLRGVAGQKLIEVDATGREIRVVGEIPPKKGQDLTLALDINVQMAAEKKFTGAAGAFVAIDPRTGEILGFMSKPSFDPNAFVNGISSVDWKQLMDDKDHPMLDRVFQSMYPPGSTFKIITAMAALESGAVKPDDMVSCPPTFNLGRHVFHDWKKNGHGIISIKTAIIQSCDVFFYKAGLKTGIEEIAKYARAFGLGSKAGLGLGYEASGLVPDSAWKEHVYKSPWYPGDTVSSSIGQSYVLVTPLQMARLVGAVGTGGKFLPKLSFTKLNPGATPRLEPVGLQVSDQTIALLQAALQGVVNESDGTAYRSRSALVSISGKTGTAQTVNGGKRYDSWFVSYAPSADPEIALAVMVEHTLQEGASAAAPVAKDVIEAYIKEKEGKLAPGALCNTVVPGENPLIKGAAKKGGSEKAKGGGFINSGAGKGKPEGGMANEGR
ncbi:MAG: penicillin-binding protein 2 [Nitrospiraceae bacterium]|nr:penicillin-binding protein 2 [Nitrospiraceae bacterium]